MMTLDWVRVFEPDEKVPNLLELVRSVFPDASDDEAGYVLWNHTSFPFGSGDPNMTAVQWYTKQLKLLKLAQDSDG